jgi:hypothetical protein
MLNTVAASKETEKKAAIKKKAAQTNADQIKNSDDGIDAREPAEQNMKQDEDDATEVLKKHAKSSKKMNSSLKKQRKNLSD